MPQRQGRILVSSFASNVHRMQQAIDVAVQCDRQVAVVGRSMRKNLNIARNLGYMEVTDGVLVRPHVVQELQRDSTELFQCESCTRILYYVERTPATAQAAISANQPGEEIAGERMLPGSGK